MRLYLCTSEHGIRRAECLGYRAGQDHLVLAHDAVYDSRQGEQVVACAADLALRGLGAGRKSVSDSELLGMVMEHEQVIIL